MKVVVLLVSLFFTHFSLAQSYSQRQLIMSKINCSSWQEVKATINFKSSQEENEIFQIHSDFKRFLDTVERQIFTSFQNSQFNRTILLCSQLEEQSLDFSVPCFDSQGNNVLSQDIVQTCLNLHQ